MKLAAIKEHMVALRRLSILSKFHRAHDICDIDT